jgi:hypothetical protein
VTHVSEQAHYFLGYSVAEQRRLQQQALELAQEPAWLFDQIGVELDPGVGQKAIERWHRRFVTSAPPCALAL